MDCNYVVATVSYSTHVRTGIFDMEAIMRYVWRTDGQLTFVFC